MVLDECTPYPIAAEAAARLDAPLDALGRALQGRLSARARATACSASCRAASLPSCAPSRPGRWLQAGFDGYAIGGLAVGEAQALMFEILEATVPASAGRSARAI